jgi:hypothetical protein
MTSEDLLFITDLANKGMLSDPVLELGGGYGGATCRDTVIAFGKRYVATDMFAADGIDYVADFESGSGVDALVEAGPFGTTLVLNVLEHTFNPIAVLDNAVRVTCPNGGRIVVITPAVWPIHNYPRDYCRLLPDWYRQYAARTCLQLEESTFAYVGFGPVARFSLTGQDRFPLPGVIRPAHRAWSRIVHKLFNTYGRGMAQPSHVAIGLSFRRV